MNTLRIPLLFLSLCLLVITLVLFSVEPTSIATAHVLAQDNPPVAGPQVLITRNINVRSAPSTNSSVITVAQPDQRFTVTGRTADSAWWRINYNGQAAWLYANLVQATNTANVPVVDLTAGTPPTPASAGSN